MCVVEVAGVCVCACAWLKWGANIIISEKGSPTWEVAGWLLGGLAPSLHPWLICYVQKHAYACSQGTARATAVSHCIAHRGPLQHGVHTPRGQKAST